MKPETATVPFETLRYDPDATGSLAAAPGFVRLDRHLRRWERSCAWLGVPADTAALVAALNAAVQGLSGAQRVRATLRPDGQIEVTHTPLAQPRFFDTPVEAMDAAHGRLVSGSELPRCALADQRVDETDPARAHKTTSRSLHYAGRRYAEANGLEDVLFLDSRGLLCEGSIATVFVATRVGGEAVVLTPALSTGALPGVLREELLERGLVHEHDIDEPMVRGAVAVMLGSSVRGLRVVDLQPGTVDVELGG